MKIFERIRKRFNKDKGGEYDSVAEFFLHAPWEEKERVFRESAMRANEDQREVLKQANLKLKTR